MLLWIVVGLAGFVVWVHGILTYDSGHAVPGWVEIVMGGMLMFITMNLNPWRLRRLRRRSRGNR